MFGRRFLVFDELADSVDVDEFGEVGAVAFPGGELFLLVLVE